MGNPFLDECPELLVLNFASEQVVETIKALGTRNNYVHGIIVSRDKGKHPRKLN